MKALDRELQASLANMTLPAQLQKTLILIQTIERLLPEEEALTLSFQDGFYLKCPSAQLAEISQTVKAALEWNPQQRVLEIPLPCGADLLDPIRCALGGYLSDILTTMMVKPDRLLPLINILDYLCVDLAGAAPDWKILYEGYFERRRRAGYHFTISTNVKSLTLKLLKKGRYDDIARMRDWDKCKTPEEKALEASQLIGFPREELLPVMTKEGNPRENLAAFIKDNIENFFFCGTVRLVGIGKPSTLKSGSMYSVTESLTPKPYPKDFLTCLLKMGFDPKKLACRIVINGLFDLSWDDLNDFEAYPPIQDAIIAYLSMMRICYHGE